MGTVGAQWRICNKIKADCGTNKVVTELKDRGVIFPTFTTPRFFLSDSLVVRRKHRINDILTREAHEK